MIDPLEAALMVATPKAKVVGLWLASHRGLSCIGPSIGILLSKLQQEVSEQARQELDPLTRAVLMEFVEAQRQVSLVELVHEGAIIRTIQKMVEASDET
mgnify:CR=1 FL=1